MKKMVRMVGELLKLILKAGLNIFLTLVGLGKGFVAGTFVSVFIAFWFADNLFCILSEESYHDLTLMIVKEDQAAKAENIGMLLGQVMGMSFLVVLFVGLMSLIVLV